MTYGFCPENWPAFQSELQKRDIAVADIEKVEMRPEVTSVEIAQGIVEVTVTLRSGRIESWSHRQTEGM
jgi:hypothetical protein